MTRFTALALLGAALAGLAFACDGDSPGTDCGACTLEFRYYTVTVLDGGENPVNDLALTRVNQRTGRTLEPGWLGLLVPGVYLVADDGLLDEFSSVGDRLRVTGARAGVSFSEEFVFATDPCRCHLLKVSGPDTVTIAP